METLSFYLLTGHIATLFVCFKFALVLTFQSPVVGIGGASQAQVEISKSSNFNKGRTIMINPKTEKLDSNLIVFTKDGRSYRFYLKFDKSLAFDFVNVYMGMVNRSYALKKETDSYKIYEGKTSIKIENKGKTPLYVNNIGIKKYKYLSKGIPLFIERKSKNNINRQGLMIVEGGK